MREQAEISKQRIKERSLSKERINQLNKLSQDLFKDGLSSTRSNNRKKSSIKMMHKTGRRVKEKSTLRLKES